MSLPDIKGLSFELHYCHTNETSRGEREMTWMLSADLPTAWVSQRVSTVPEDREKLSSTSIH
jgi:hypothetical protein